MTPDLVLRLRTLLVILLAVLGILVGMLFRMRNPIQSLPVVTVRFLNLSDGDCAVIQTPDSKFILIDAGGSHCGDEVVTALKQLGAHQVDLLVLASSGDSGLGGVPALLRSGITIKSVWNNRITDNASELGRVTDDIEARNIPVRRVHANEQTQIGSSQMQLTVVWPPEHGERAIADALVCRIDYGSESCAFLGPLLADSEPYIVSGAWDKLNADVLQVAEHGDGEGTSLELLRRAQPEFAVISSTAASTPAPATLQRLQAAGASIWRTDRQGTVTVMLTTGSNGPLVTGSQL